VYRKNDPQQIFAQQSSIHWDTPDNVCAQGHERMYDINLLPPYSFCCQLRALIFNGALSKHVMFNHSHIVIPLQTNFSTSILEMEPHFQTYSMLGQGGQVSGGSGKKAIERTQYRLTYN